MMKTISCTLFVYLISVTILVTSGLLIESDEDGTHQLRHTTIESSTKVHHLKRRPPGKVPGPRFDEEETKNQAELYSHFINIDDSFMFLMDTKKKNKEPKIQLESEHTKNYNNNGKKSENGEVNKRSFSNETEIAMNRDAGLPENPREFVFEPPEENSTDETPL